MAEPTTDEHPTGTRDAIRYALSTLALDHGHDDIVSVHADTVADALTALFTTRLADQVERIIGELGTVIEERDEAREQVKHATDLKLIRFAISDPGAFVKRERVHDDQYETVPAWSARAVVVALREGRGNR